MSDWARATDSASLTVGIASFQRRGHLCRLLGTLADALRSSHYDNVEVIVVLDGSTDGSDMLVDKFAESYPVPLRSYWQPNTGLAAARNRCVDESRSELVWLLDDDMRVTSAALDLHRGHDRTIASFLMGPCHISTDNPDLARAGAFYATRHASLSFDRRVREPRDCSFANTSGPSAMLRAHRFDERFRGYGVEDFDLAARLLAAGEVIAFDPAAEVIHDFRPSRSERLRKLREEGVNKAMFAKLYPERASIVFDPAAGRAERSLRRVAAGPLARPLSFAANVISAAATVLPRRLGRHLMLEYADLLAVYSGVSEQARG